MLIKMEGEKYRVAFVIGKMVGGGLESVILDVLKGIDSNKYKIDLIIDSDSTYIPYERIKEMNVALYQITPYQHLFGFLRDLNVLFRKQKYDIVHAHMSSLNVFPLFIAWINRVSIRISHNHNLISPGDGKLKNFIKWVLSRFAKIFPTALAAPSLETGKWIFGNKSFEIIPNGVDIEKFRYSETSREEIRKKLGVANNRILVGNFGRFVGYKNQKKFLEIVLYLLLNGAQVTGLLVGDGPLKSELKSFIDSNKLLKDNVILQNTVSDIERYYSATDFFLFTSTDEAYGLVSVEAQLSGNVVLAGPGIPDITNIGENLFHKHDNFDVKEWSEDLLSIKLLSKFEREKIIEMLPNRTNFDRETMSENFENFYDKLISK